jgi:hypothetical protein
MVDLTPFVDRAAGRSASSEQFPLGARYFVIAMRD